MPSDSKEPLDSLYENLMFGLFRAEGFQVQKDPIINRKTPDLLVQSENGLSCIVECTTAHDKVHYGVDREVRSNDNGLEFRMIDDSNPWKKNEKLWSSIDGKLRKYGASTFPDYALVIAVNNRTFFSYDLNAVEVCFGQYQLQVLLADGEAIGHRWERALAEEFDLPFFRGKGSQHCSAIIHSTNLFQLACEDGEIKHINNRDAHHLLIPNPYATHEVPEKLFPFCEVLDLPHLFNADFTVPVRKPLT